MSRHPAPPQPDLLLPEPLPAWIRTAARGDEAGFAAGAALAALHPLAKDGRPPALIWRRRLALSAAVALTGTDEASLRDHWHLRRAGDDPGPAGRVLGAFRQLGEPRALARLDRLLAQFDLAPDPALEAAIDAAASARGAPVEAAACAAQAILAHDLRTHGLALWLADAVLARAMGWELALPLLPGALRRADFRLAVEAPEAFRLALSRGIALGAVAAHDLFRELTPRVQKLLLVGRKLRGKEAQDRIARLLAEDAVAAQAGRLTSDRAARRFFERLLEFQSVRELTGRASFRLYGL